jgi:hypothetical protein
MSRFTADWLALRERHDLAARNPDVLAAVAASLKSRPSVHVVDLASGSGSTARALHTHLPTRQHWDLVDNDLHLLTDAVKGDLGKEVTRNAVPLDLSRNLEAPLRNTADLIAISALLDLVSETWLHQFLRAVAARTLPVYAALTYDGRTDLSPAHQLDTAIVFAVNAHQRSDKGFGPALGPLAASAAIAGFKSLGYTVVSGESDWIIGPDDRAMQNELLEGWAGAAHDMATIPDTEIASWLAQRKAAVSTGRSSMRVGHVDFFAFPSSTR